MNVYPKFLSNTEIGPLSSPFLLLQFHHLYCLSFLLYCNYLGGFICNSHVAFMTICNILGFNDFLWLSRGACCYCLVWPEWFPPPFVPILACSFVDWIGRFWAPWRFLDWLRSVIVLIMIFIISFEASFGLHCAWLFVSIILFVWCTSGVTTVATSTPQEVSHEINEMPQRSAEWRSVKIQFVYLSRWTRYRWLTTSEHTATHSRIIHLQIVNVQIISSWIIHSTQIPSPQQERRKM